jgi:hypothetical protein
MYNGEVGFVNGLLRFSAYLFVDGIFFIPEIIKNPNTDTITSILHHCVGGLGIFIIATQRQGLGMGAYFATTEISTIVLHISWILYVNKIKGIFTTIIFSLFYMIFTLSRILTIPILIYYLWINANITATLPIFHWFMVYIGCYSLMILNVIWFIMLTRKVVPMLYCNDSIRNKEKIKQD